MELRRFIGSGIAVSAIVHVSALAMVLIFAEVHPFGSVTAEPIAVDIVAPEDVGQNKPEQPPIPKPSDSFDLSSQSAASGAPAPPAAPAAVTPPQKQAALPAPPRDRQPSAGPPRPDRQQAAGQPPPDRPQAMAQPQQPPASAAPAYVPPEPDLSVKYHVMLGLPPDLEATPQDKPGDGFDAAATTPADVASSLVDEFRRHLRTCSKLPESIAASDAVRIKLRLFLSPDGRLAGEPVLIEASASMKGPMLMRSAIKALEACQPYTMLPADRYGEWKVLDLGFTPRDFAGE